MRKWNIDAHIPKSRFRSPPDILTTSDAITKNKCWKCCLQISENSLTNLRGRFLTLPEMRYEPLSEIWTELSSSVRQRSSLIGGRRENRPTGNRLKTNSSHH